ncbi:nucleoside phosphorylase domain-containing protein [Aspergillus heterothallicus]
MQASDSASRRCLPRESFTVGLISALPLEMAAAMGMLDEIYEDFGKRPRDDNNYVVGRVAGHNCVLACLPVGRCRRKHNGVVQYDYGKTLVEGKFVRTGSINKPPIVLLTAEMGFEYSYPGSDQDVLFNAEYRHVGENDCTKYDLAKVMPRQSRGSEEPKVHYGLIASGNQVMKDAVTRDQLSKELGVMCFETEAADLANFSSRVSAAYANMPFHIRTKCWQGYAAATAATYAKELLNTIIPIDLSRQYTIKVAPRQNMRMEKSGMIVWSLRRSVGDA